ncbi:MAG: type IV pilin-like G/H family protein [Pleurocapsa minor HA4230-MV1]|jgi:hypothetical protein|nr:type IV pilin-like G/H family protein [Pleurocapsa minor HA4230-MV1]
MLITKFKIIHYFLILSIAILSTKTILVNAQNTTTNIQEIEAKNLINLLAKTEKSYFNELRRFTNSFKELNNYNLDGYDILKLTQSSESYKYKLEIFNNGNLVQTIATPINKIGLKTYTGALSFNNNVLNSIVCESKTNLQVIVGKIELVKGQLNCPRGFKIVLQDVEEKAINNVILFNSLQQGYFFLFTKFAENQSDLAKHQPIYPDNTYYEYEIDLRENGKLAQVVAQSKLDNFKSYIGGIAYLDGFF